MVGLNGNRSYSGVIFAAVDSLLIVIAVILGTYIRLWKDNIDITEIANFELKFMAIVFIIQLVFYYVDLHEVRNFKEKKKLMILLIGCLGASSVILSVLYYFMPFLTIGRGIFIISLILIFVFAFHWRLLYAWLSRKKAFKERILIIGTGDLAKMIRKEVLENGNDGFEIIGFIEESRENVGNRV
jgi:FlaA1/EpsC-like NDP-sugar epimerase